MKGAPKWGNTKLRALPLSKYCECHDMAFAVETRMMTTW